MDNGYKEWVDKEGRGGEVYRKKRLRMEGVGYCRWIRMEGVGRFEDWGGGIRMYRGWGRLRGMGGGGQSRWGSLRGIWR